MAQLRQISPRPRSPRQLRPKRSLIQLLCEEVEQLEARKREARAMRDRVLAEMKSTSEEMIVKTMTAEVVVSVTTMPVSADISKVVEVTETVVEIVEEEEVVAIMPEVVEMPEPAEEELTNNKSSAAAEVPVTELEQPSATEPTSTVLVEPSDMMHHHEDLSSSISEAGSDSESDTDSDHSSLSSSFSSSCAPALSSETTTPADTQPSTPFTHSTVAHPPMTITPLMLSSPLSMSAVLPPEPSSSLKRRSNYWSFDKEGSFWLCTSEGCVTADKSGPFYGQRCEHGVCVWKEYCIPREAGLTVSIN